MRCSVKARWLPGEPHTHTYFLVIGDKTVGKIGPNPRRTRGEATWLCFQAVASGKFRPIGGEWMKRDAMDRVEESTT